MLTAYCLAFAPGAADHFDLHVLVDDRTVLRSKVGGHGEVRWYSLMYSDGAAMRSLGDVGFDHRDRPRGDTQTSIRQTAPMLPQYRATPDAIKASPPLLR
jgi:hypothetical protein